MIAVRHLLLGAVWISAAPGVWLREEPMSTSGPLAHVRAITVRVDPKRNEFRLDMARSRTGIEAQWTLDSMPANAVVALNAGQFTGGFPWGWVVRNNRESQPPGRGSLAMALVVDSAGSVALVTPDEIPSWRGRAVSAFQSYPAIIVDGRIPWELDQTGRGVDIEHHDSRLAVCTLRDNSLIVVLTRFIGSPLPWGPTIPQMANYMLSLGCTRAMLLDGGISSQLAVRNSNGTLQQWTNFRRVPLGLIIAPRN